MSPPFLATQRSEGSRDASLHANRHPGRAATPKWAQTQNTQTLAAEVLIGIELTSAQSITPRPGAGGRCHDEAGHCVSERRKTVSFCIEARVPVHAQPQVVRRDSSDGEATCTRRG